MPTDHRVVALVPLRGGSKSIPDKNIRPLCGKPLCAWVLEAATAARGIDAVYVSTDSDRIKAVVESLGLGVRVIDRPAALAQDHSGTEEVMTHFASCVPFDILCTIQATSPLLRAADLNRAISRMHTENLDSMLTAVREKRFYWTDDAAPINYDPMARPRRQDFAGTLMENGAFYLTRRPILDQYACRLGGRIGIHEMSSATTLEIDEPHDWLAVDALLKTEKHQ